MDNIRQGSEIAVKATVIGTMTGWNSGPKYRVKINDTETWVTLKDIVTEKEEKEEDK